MTNIKEHTTIRTTQVGAFDNEAMIIDRDFMLTDLIITSRLEGIVTLVATDDNHTHIIKTIRPNGEFNHAFEGGWMFWKGAKLKIIKEKDGIVDVAVGFVKNQNARDYNIWRL